MKRVKESRAFFRKKKKASEEELKKNEGAILKFVKNASAKETEEVSSHSKSLPQVETEEEEEVYLEQNNNEVIIERSQPMNETLSDKDKRDDIYYSHNDVATWPKVLSSIRWENPCHYCFPQMFLFTVFDPLRESLPLLFSANIDIYWKNYETGKGRIDKL